jgi:hypothetical protein
MVSMAIYYPPIYYILLMWCYVYWRKRGKTKETESKADSMSMLVSMHMKPWSSALGKSAIVSIEPPIKISCAFVLMAATILFPRAPDPSLVLALARAGRPATIAHGQTPTGRAWPSCHRPPMRLGPLLPSCTALALAGGPPRQIGRAPTLPCPLLCFKVRRRTGKGNRSFIRGLIAKTVTQMNSVK